MKKQHFYTNPLRYDVSRSSCIHAHTCMNAPISYFSNINSPSIVLFKWPQIWHKGEQSRMWNDVLHNAMPVFFSWKSCKNSNLGFHLWSIYACIYQHPFEHLVKKVIQKLNVGFHFVKHLPKSFLALCKAHMVVCGT